MNPKCTYMYELLGVICILVWLAPMYIFTTQFFQTLVLFQAKFTPPNHPLRPTSIYQTAPSVWVASYAAIFSVTPPSPHEWRLWGESGGATLKMAA